MLIIIELHILTSCIFNTGTLTHLYAVRAANDPNYGIGKGKKVISEKDYNIWDRAVITLDRNDAKEMTMLILILCGTFFGLRGSEEHANLELNNVEMGSYAPGTAFHGYEYIGLTNLTDKSHKLRCVNE